MKMPTPNERGVYWFRGGSIVCPSISGESWVAARSFDSEVPLLDDRNCIRYFPTPQDAARALGFTIDE